MWVFGKSPKNPKVARILACGQAEKVIPCFPQSCAQLRVRSARPPAGHKQANSFIFNIRFDPLFSCRESRKNLKKTGKKRPADETLPGTWRRLILLFSWVASRWETLGDFRPGNGIVAQALLSVSRRSAHLHRPQGAVGFSPPNPWPGTDFKAPASSAKKLDLHHLGGLATGIMPVYCRTVLWLFNLVEPLVERLQRLLIERRAGCAHQAGHAQHGEAVHHLSHAVGDLKASGRAAGKL